MWALAGHATAAASWLVTIPFLIRFLSPEEYAIYAFSTVFAASLAFVDMGMGLTTVRFASAENVRVADGREVPVVWTGLMIGGLSSTVAYVVVALQAEMILGLFARADSAILGTAVTAFRIGAVLCVLRSVAAVLAAPQLSRLRTDIQGRIIAAANVGQVLLTILVLSLGGGLRAAIGMVAVGASAVVFSNLLVARSLLPSVLPPRMDRALISPMLALGIPVMVSSLASVALSQSEKLVLATFESAEALAPYWTGFTAASIFALFGLALAHPIVATFSKGLESGGGQEVRKLYGEVVRWTSTIAWPVAILMAAAAPYFFHAWAGPNFASDATIVFRILIIGGVFNLLAHVPFHWLIAAGNSRKIAILHLVEVPFHIGFAIFLVSNYGIAGAAVAWTARSLVDCVLLFMVAATTSQVKIKNSNTMRHLLLLAFLIGAAVTLALLVQSRGLVAAGMVAATAMYCLLTVASMGEDERRNVIGFFRSLVRVTH
jgi:O-antigen/teichoic acid export membrane protein